MITYVKGDVTTANPSIGAIAHICNDIGLFNAGVAKSIRNKWPNAYEKYKNEELYLGKNIYCNIRPKFYIVHMIAQKGVRSKTNPIPINYGALERCLTLLNQCHEKYEFHMPRIGTGYAGGDWSIIEPMINTILADRSVYVWEL